MAEWATWSHRHAGQQEQMWQIVGIYTPPKQLNVVRFRYWYVTRIPTGCTLDTPPRRGLFTIELEKGPPREWS